MSGKQGAVPFVCLLLTAHCLLLLDSEKRLAVFDSLAVLDIDFDDFAGCLSLNFVHQLHCFDDAVDVSASTLLPMRTKLSVVGDGAR